jgi:hypothetical protein
MQSATLPRRAPVRQGGTRPRPRPLLSYRLHFLPFDGNPGQLTVWTGRQAQDYEIRSIPSDWGLAYSLTKLSVEGPTVTYHVCLDAERGTDGQHVCDCPGHEAHGRCKHVRCLLRLLERGELRTQHQPDPAPAAGHDDEEAPF